MDFESVGPSIERALQSLSVLVSQHKALQNVGNKVFLWKMYEVYRGSKVEQVDRDGLSGLRRYRGRACRWIPCCAMALRLTLPYMQAETNGNLGTSRVVWGLFSPGHGLELCAERWQRRNLVSAVIG